MHDKSAFRAGSLLFCKAHWPADPAQMHECRVVKREALVGKKCATCQEPFLVDQPEPDRFATERRFKQQWDEDVKAGKAYPAAGDLFDAEGR